MICIIMSCYIKFHNYWNKLLRRRWYTCIQLFWNGSSLCFSSFVGLSKVAVATGVIWMNTMAIFFDCLLETNENSVVFSADQKSNIGKWLLCMLQSGNIAMNNYADYCVTMVIILRHQLTFRLLWTFAGLVAPDMWRPKAFSRSWFLKKHAHTKALKRSKHWQPTD